MYILNLYSLYSFGKLVTWIICVFVFLVCLCAYDGRLQRIFSFFHPFIIFLAMDSNLCNWTGPITKKKHYVCMFIPISESFTHTTNIHTHTTIIVKNNNNNNKDSSICCLCECGCVSIDILFHYCAACI